MSLTEYYSAIKPRSLAILCNVNGVRDHSVRRSKAGAEKQHMFFLVYRSWKLGPAKEKSGVVVNGVMGGRRLNG